MSLNYFHLPNSTIFHGVPGKPKGYTFGQARKITTDSIKVKRLKLRLETYYIHGLQNTGHPFIASIMTCVGIEVLGQVMLGVNGKGETIESNTISIYQMMDPLLSSPVSATFKNNYNRGRKYPNSGPDCTGSLPTYAHILRKGLRNSFTHSYRTLGVVLRDDLNQMIKVDELKGVLIVNPKKYREQYERLFETMFESATKSTNPTWKTNVVDYFDILIK